MGSVGTPLFSSAPISAPVFTLAEQPILTRKKLRIVCIGAGYSGLTLAHKIQHECALEEDIDLSIYEKNPEVGGTWYENRYPGAACDIPARKSILHYQGCH